MRIGTSQHMRIDQRMKLAPRMIHSMEVLQMPLQALEERIEQELSSNPTLEQLDHDARDNLEQLQNEQAQRDRDASEAGRELVVQDGGDNSGQVDDFERLTNFAEEYGDAWAANTYETGEGLSSRVRDSGERDHKLEAMANTAARPRSLVEQLLAQWSLVDKPLAVDQAGQYLIGLIDQDGYLRTPRQTVLSQAPPGVLEQDLDRALALIQQSLEPVGIGARDLSECLLLQIDAETRTAASRGRVDPDHDPFSIERLLVSRYAKDLEANRLPRICRSADLSMEQIKQALAGLRRYNPCPGRLLVDDQPRVITPDAIVEYDEQQDRYVARLTHERLPNVRLSRRYLKMVRDARFDTQTRRFVSDNLRSARWLIEAIQQRHSTLLRVINVVLEAQRDFFDHGPQYLKPLPMTLVADQLGIHVATVSRAVHEKHLQTPQGVLPLRMFFSGGTETESGDTMSWAAVQAKLEEVIGQEDKSKPLSDDQLVEVLKEHGIDIARRTVAKYRKQLNIPVARQRKQY